MTTHKAFIGWTGDRAPDHRGTVELQTLHVVGLYSVAKRPTIAPQAFIVTHTPTALVVSSGKDLPEAIKIADALDRAFKSTGKNVRWGDSQTLTMELNSVNDIVKVCAAARENNP